MKFIIPGFETNNIVQINIAHTIQNKRIMTVYLFEKNEDVISDILSACRAVNKDTVIQVVTDDNSVFEYQNFVFDIFHFEVAVMSQDEIDAGNVEGAMSNCTLHFRTL